jgi:hypothetical protein
MRLDVRPWTDVDGPSAALPRCSCSQRAFPTWCGHSAWQRSARLCQPDRRTDNDAHSASSTREAEDVTNAAVREQEDQYHDLYVKEVTFHGGPRLVLHGLTDHSAHTTQIILGAIFGPRSERLPEQYVQQAGRLTRLVLSLSNVICTAAGLRRGVAATELERRDLFVPGRERLVELCAIVTFTQAELAHVLAGHPEGAGQPRRLLPAGGPDRGGDHHLGEGGRRPGADPGSGAPGHPGSRRGAAGVEEPMTLNVAGNGLFLATSLVGRRRDLRHRRWGPAVS